LKIYFLKQSNIETERAIKLHFTARYSPTIFWTKINLVGYVAFTKNGISNFDN